MIPGYFTHVTTLAEVKEQVLKYIPVMARPLVLLREQHPIRWTGVYADIEVSINYLPQFQIKHTRYNLYYTCMYRICNRYIQYIVTRFGRVL